METANLFKSDIFLKGEKVFIRLVFSRVAKWVPDEIENVLISIQDKQKWQYNIRIIQKPIKL